MGSFSAVSKPNFASKYSLESSRRDLHNALLCTVLESNPKNQENHGEKRTRAIARFSADLIAELCKGVHCVDLDESFPTHIYLQNLASIQPRTSPLKFAASVHLEEV